jgi:hypothetical protein
MEIRIQLQYIYWIFKQTSKMTTEAEGLYCLFSSMVMNYETQGGRKRGG